MKEWLKFAFWSVCFVALTALMTCTQIACDRNIRRNEERKHLNSLLDAIEMAPRDPKTGFPCPVRSSKVTDIFGHRILFRLIENGDSLILSIISPGPDGVTDTDDDIIVTRTFSRHPIEK